MKFHKAPVSFVGQVNIKVQDLERSLQFYKEVVGFKVIEQTDESANLSADGETVLLSIEQPKDVVRKQARTTGLYHFAILLPERSDLANFVQHYSKFGLQLASSDHLVSEALYFSDPDGNGIEIYVDRDHREWRWHSDLVEMTVDPLDFNDLLSNSSDEGWNGLPSETVMGHIHLHVSELEKTEVFYSKGLGLEVVCRFGSQALFMSDGKYHHHIGLNIWNGVGAPTPSPNSVGLESFTLMLPNEEKRNEVVTQLNKIGATVTERKNCYITTDPSGNKICLKI
ncbi:VOC family protein [Evansella cellulosilytica]|uniref:Glyoxalase/bleomycin resistance protein/dioxygenase n=1 Tax=Evansella cellulosilytica (strain ATCC 21833 / DSM 2522 / FERM P-1141 / JCM 9156 / N-4) TaxID=649639 RepID=E6TTE9_EVAC2|nr:VOC family protein [Evansella cellulosilytica]ADU29585.1 Glyoxalase/bleomycin resistance protein/dioxygenase [Evansella cellulosilytica DSM 2522]